MKVFVTGATGFIGLKLVEHLIQNGFNGEKVDCYCLVRNPLSLPDEIRSRVNVLKGDLSEVQNYQDILQEMEYVFHLAAKASLGDGSEYWQVNVEGTLKLITTLKTSKFLKRFIFTSTIGAVDRSPVDNCMQLLSEDIVPHPLSDYGKSKLQCETDITQSGIPYTIIRPTWVYGPGMRENSHIRVFLKSIANKKFFTRFNFPGKVSVVHVDDLVQAIVLAANHPDAKNQTYFVSDGNPVAIGGIFRVLGKALGKPSGKIQLPANLPLLFRNLRRFLPLSAQNLFFDVLCASNMKIISIGFRPTKTQQNSFFELSHWHYQKKSDNLKSQPYALVTGGASGIGKALCEQLYAQGYEIYLVDRDEKKAENALRQINGKFLLFDLNKPDDLTRLSSFLAGHAEEIGLLINCAGIGKRGANSDLKPEEISAIIQINSFAPALLNNVFIKEAAKGSVKKTIINIGSSAAYQPLPYMAVYAASKAFLVSFSNGLIGEMNRTHNNLIEIITASPSGTATSFQDTAGVKNEDEAKLLPPEFVAFNIISAIGKGSQHIIIGNSGKLMALLSRILPEMFKIRLWEYMMRKNR